MNRNVRSFLLTAAAVLAAALAVRAGEREAPPVAAPPSTPLPHAWILDSSGIKSKVRGLKLYEEQLGFFTLNDVSIEHFRFLFGKTVLEIPLDRIRSINFEASRVKAVSFFDERVEALLEKDVKFTVEGQYEFAKYRVPLAKVRSIEFDAPLVPVLYCEGCKRFFAQSQWRFCPYDGIRLAKHSMARVGSSLKTEEGKKSGPWRGWKPEMESGITAHVTDDRGKKIAIENAQLYRERVGLLSVKMEPSDSFVLKIGSGQIDVEFRKIKTLTLDRKTAVLTDFEDRTFKADLDMVEKFFLKGRYKFAKATIDLQNLQTVTFLKPTGDVKRCESCRRLFSPTGWTHCPYDGTPLKK